jgi:hypothetical protein
MTDPRALLEAIAAQVTTFGIRAVAGRAPLAWRDQSDPGRYAVVTHVAPFAPALRGDAATIRDTTQVDISVWETPAQAATSTDAGTIGDLVDELEGAANALGIRALSTSTLVIPEPDSDDVHTSITATYVVGR